MNLLEKIISGIGSSLGQVAILLLDCVEKVVVLINRFLDMKDSKEKKENLENKNKDLKDICDNGTLDDLINKKFGIFVALLGILLSGCISRNEEINVLTTKSWEGHYENVLDFYEKTKSISLGENESIWVLSNTTLYMILKEKNEN